jgi:hypothetical protein
MQARIRCNEFQLDAFANRIDSILDELRASCTNTPLPIALDGAYLLIDEAVSGSVGEMANSDSHNVVQGTRGGGVPTVDAEVAPQTVSVGDGKNSTDEHLTTTEKKILGLCRQKAYKGQVIANRLDLTYDHIRSVCAKLKKAGRLRLTDDGYRTVRKP